MGDSPLAPAQLERVMSAVDDALLRSDRDDLRELGPFLGPIALDACLERARRFRGQRVAIVSAETGSITVDLVLAWILGAVISGVAGAITSSLIENRAALFAQLKDLLKRKLPQLAAYLQVVFRRQGIRARVYCKPNGGAGEGTVLCIDVSDLDASTTNLLSNSQAFSLLERSEDEMAKYLRLSQARLRRLGEILVALGVLTPEQAEDVARIQRNRRQAPRPRYGEILVEQGRVGQEVIDDVLRLQGHSKTPEQDR